MITHNVLAGGKASAYPAGNLFPSVDELRSQFVDAAARDYRLLPRSAWMHAASDGRALGADLTQIAPQTAAHCYSAREAEAELGDRALHGDAGLPPEIAESPH